MARGRSSSLQGGRNTVAGFHLPKLGDRTQRGDKLGIGFDFGTSNSAVAVFDGRGVTVVSLEDSGLVMPSATYIDKAFRAEVGQRAIVEYIERNRGRRVEFRAEVLGEARVSTGEYDEQSGLPTTADTFTLYGNEVSVHGLALGGNLIDQTVVRELVLPLRCTAPIPSDTPLKRSAGGR